MSATAEVGDRPTPPGHVEVLTINARQSKVLGLKRFTELYELAGAIRNRPPAFDGGYYGAVAAPDVIVLQEVRPSNADIFERMVKQRFDFDYEIVGTNDAAAVIMINVDTVTAASTVGWADPCDDDRRYQLARLIERATSLPFAVAGVHLANRYPASDCVDRNLIELRTRLETESSAAIIAGDFERTPRVEPLACDPSERSAPQPWWTQLTEPSIGRVYLDAVRAHHHETGDSMRDEWTYQHGTFDPTCDDAGSIPRRMRTDFIFASDAVLAEAHTDHPGWAEGAAPRYSDHRFVWSRLVLSEVARPGRPAAHEDAGGVVRLAWQPQTDAVGWVIFRARVGRSYSTISRVEGPVTSFTDRDAEHARHYRYAIAAVGADSSQSLESRPVFAVPDARGPHVATVSPPPGATGQPVHVDIEVRFDENVPGAAVDGDTIKLFRTDTGTRIEGRVKRIGPRYVVFDVIGELKPGKTYRVVVSGQEDRLGNEGPRYSWRFTTKQAAKKRRR